jgi:hypothetical protein
MKGRTDGRTEGNWPAQEGNEGTKDGRKLREEGRKDERNERRKAEVRADGRTDERTDGRTEGRKLASASTLELIGAHFRRANSGRAGGSCRRLKHDAPGRCRWVCGWVERMKAVIVPYK